MIEELREHTRTILLAFRDVTGLSILPIMNACGNRLIANMDDKQLTDCATLTARLLRSATEAKWNVRRNSVRTMPGDMVAVYMCGNDKLAADAGDEFLSRFGNEPDEETIQALNTLFGETGRAVVCLPANEEAA